MALSKNKRLRLTTNPQQDNGSIVHQTNNSVNGSHAQRSTNERDQRVQREQPSNERNRRDQTSTNGMQQRRQRDQISNHELREQREQRNQNPSNEMHQSSQRDQIFPNERSEHRQQGRQTNQQSSNLRHNNSSEESGGSSHRNDVYEYTIEDTNGNRRRGKTVLADVWNLPDGQRIVVEVNKENQPIGDEGGVLGYFCGTVARNGSLCSLTYTRWDLLKKGCNKNNQKLILQEVERRFLYPKALEKWILKSIGHKWIDYKCYLKGKGYDDDTDVNTLYDNCPDDDVDYDQWKRSKRSKESHAKAKVKPIHTTGTKSHARVREEMKKKFKQEPITYSSLFTMSPT
ncbi:uncharacterized protein LOC110721201 isoform X2 [Chenopodium quinoa]|uniref:uncharacterized protein LOC110721201 isoform X2 n=1 Tax=Chenopodium quinoa TaxID=63459 RepID=UPI000B780C8D|nr:uncharacterized protein LOC110721201 isoform X2 [Chenopodium quinoa]